MARYAVGDYLSVSSGVNGAMVQADHTVGVCLYKLDAREEAVLKRVVTFSGSQGRNYVLAELAAAQLIVVSNDTAVDLAAMHPEGAMLIRISDQESAQPYDLLMQRPLLVTRVMRTLDEARKLWTDSLLAPVVSEPVHLTVVESVVSAPIVQEQRQPVLEAEPAPLLIAAETVQLEIAKAPVALAANTEQTSAEVIESVVETEALAVPVQAELVATHQLEPVAPAIQAPNPPLEAPVEAGGDYHHRALVVDDSAAIRKQLELELRQAGIASDFAETGEEALEKVASNRYDLVFLDIIMPGIDGYETCRQIRMRKEMKKTPIIMLSAKTSPLDEVQGVIAGASTYLTKPVKSDQLQKTLKRVAMWLDNFQQARS